MSSRDDAIRQMLAMGMPDFPPGHPIVNAGKVTRYGPKKKAWYILYEFRTRTGQYLVGGSYGIWGELDSTKIEIDWKGQSEEDRERHAKERALSEARERNKATNRARDAAERGRQQWNTGRTSKPEGIETYLDRKGVAHTKGLRYFADGTVLVPMIRYDITESMEQAPGYTGPRRLLGLQKISPDGRKLFNKGLAKEGAMCRLGNAPKHGELLMLTEGLATGLSVRMGIKEQHAVFVAFDAGNLLHAARILRKLYPQNPLLILADDDAYLDASMNKLLRENYGIEETIKCPRGSDTPVKGSVLQDGRRVPMDISVHCEGVVDEDGVPGIIGEVRFADKQYLFNRQNAGRRYALRAAREVGNAEVVYPAFSERKLLPDPDVSKLTDYNDLHKAEGLDAVARQLGPELEREKLNAQVRALLRVELDKRKKDPKPPKDGGGGRAKPPSDDDGFDWGAFFQRYAVIYPSDTLWDAARREIVKLAHVRIAWTDSVVNRWLASDKRRLVNIDQLVFEPGEEVKAPAINLYRGLAMKPSDKGSCDKLIALLRYLCNEGGELQEKTPISDWVLKWLAYPLQHPGAKMETSLVFHGPEGAGKNKFFNQIRRIYGEYGTLITQSELEDKFNGWLSRRLFIIANEVISRAELRHHVGKLKNYVTESPLPIRDMWSPTRYESNHAQFVFLTNEVQAMFLGQDDRRYVVIWTPPRQDKTVYEEVDEEINAGGTEALLNYLLKLDLGDFNEHSKPPMTEAKEMLIEMGLSSVQMFQKHLHDNLLHPLTYSTCQVEDLYRAYQRYCARTGERNPRRMNQFSPEFMRMNGVTRGLRDIQRADAATNTPRRQATLMFMGADQAKLSGDGPSVVGERKQAIAMWKSNLKAYLELDELGMPGSSKRGESDAH